MAAVAAVAAAVAPGIAPKNARFAGEERERFASAWAENTTEIFRGSALRWSMVG